MVRIFPLIFILLWSSAFITTKPIIDNSDPFSALAFRFFFVAIGFYLFSIYSKHSIIIKKKGGPEVLEVKDVSLEAADNALLAMKNWRGKENLKNISL